MMLKSAHLFDYFDLIIGNDEITQPKPHPEIYLTAFHKLKIEPYEAIIVEDSPHGIEAAKLSGAHVIKVVRCLKTTPLFKEALWLWLQSIKKRS